MLVYIYIYINIRSPAQIRPGRPISSPEALLLDVTARWHGGGRGYNLEVYIYIYTPGCKGTVAAEAKPV
jgi:hypothetical protein